MKELIMMIIKMIDEGKITADQGVELIKAVRSTGIYNREASAEMKNKVKTHVKKVIDEAEPKVKAATHKIVKKSGEVAENISNSVKDYRAKKAAQMAEEESYETADDYIVPPDVETTDIETPEVDTPEENEL
jgi:polyhydroxyalkanoate synthesis regulator phasin